jgi:signal transduction histidine kinase
MKHALSQGLILPNRRLTLRLRVTFSMVGLTMLFNIGAMLLIFILIPQANQVMSVGRTLASLIMMILITGGCAYWIAGMVLRPVQEISQATRRIDADTLKLRLDVPIPHDELKELAEAFNAMLSRLEQAFEQQSLFALNAAHELRTPLTILRTNLEVIGRDSTATLTDYQAMCMSLEHQLTRLEHLVSDLLLLTIEKQSLTVEGVSLLSLLKDVCNDLMPLASTQQVTITTQVESDLCVCGDGLLLNRAFSNLVENAIRYNHPGGKVAISIQHDSHWVRVVIADTGIGIKHADIAHIFDSFYRVDHSRTRHKGGAGLGLALVSHIAKQHGGSIQVQSTPQYGSTFTVLLPLKHS